MPETAEHHPEHTGSLRTLWRIRTFLRPHLGWFIAAMALTLSLSVLRLALPYAFGQGINALQTGLALEGAERSDYWRSVVLGRWTVFLMAVVVGLSAARFAAGLVRAHFRQRVLTDMRCALFNAVQHLSLDYHTGTTTGELISRGTRDVDRIRRFFAGVLFSSAQLLLTVAGVVAMMARTRWSLVLLCLWTLPISGYLLARFARRLRPMWRRASDLYGQVTTVLQENIAGTRVVKAFGREDDEIRKFESASRRYLGQAIEATWYWAGRMPLANFVFGLSIPALVGYGGMLVSRGAMTAGDLITYIFYLMALNQRIRMVGRIVNVVQMAAASAERVFAVLDEKPTVRERPRAKPMPAGGGQVEFRNVSFEHAPGTTALRNVTFTVPPGKMVAVVGRTGGGKSTLVSLIPRFHDPTEGQVLIDGVDVREVRLNDLRRSIGLIFQEPFLFSATIAENIAYGRPDATMEEIRACAEAAQAARFIEELPRGYDTVVGERGVTLSGGQRQRLAIARALITNPRILIMDDATSSVDSTTERLIHEQMFQIARGRTTFVIAQRLSTVRRADLILVLDRGQLVERGTHEQLLARNGAYRRLFETQLVGPEEDTAPEIR